VHISRSALSAHKLKVNFYIVIGVKYDITDGETTGEWRRRIILYCTLFYGVLSLLWYLKLAVSGWW